MTARNGKVDVRFNQKRGKARLRFHGVAPDQVETIQLALARAREELSTEFDTVALDAICVGYLCNSSSVAGPGTGC